MCSSDLHPVLGSHAGAFAQAAPPGTPQHGRADVIEHIDARQVPLDLRVGAKRGEFAAELRILRSQRPQVPGTPQRNMARAAGRPIDGEAGTKQVCGRLDWRHVAATQASGLRGRMLIALI
mgnify:CR=1 FL=1